MSDDLISIRDLAQEHGKHKQSVFKVMRRLQVVPTKQRSASQRNQLVAYVTSAEADRIRQDLVSAISDPDDDEPVDGLSGVGVFYLIQLEPEFDPLRFKVGFATTLAERLRHLRCSAPFAQVVRTWPCKSLWEKTAIDCVSANCDRLHTEVFRARSLSDVVDRCDQFFGLMPLAADRQAG